MTFDTHSLFAYSVVASVTSQTATTLILTVQAGDGVKFATNQQVTLYPTGLSPTLANAMIGRITGISTDTLTIDVSSASREGSSTQTVTTNWQIANTVTPKVLTDIETELTTLEGASMAMSRQAIINGNFDLWQRGTSTTTTTDLTYDLADRWRRILTAASGTLPTTITQSKQSLTAGDIANSYYFYRITPSGSGSGFGAGAYAGIDQKIENGARYLCGNGKKVTVSFWARSSIAGKKIGVYLGQGYGTGGSPTTEEIITGTIWTLTSTWTKYTYTLTTNTLVGKTFGTNNDDYLRLALVYMWGSSVAANAGTTGTETFGGAGNIDIAQVQVCAGGIALPFCPRDPWTELALCQRYYETSANNNSAFAHATSAVIDMWPMGGCDYKVTKRTAPTVVIKSFNGTVGSVSGAGATVDINTGVVDIRINTQAIGTVRGVSNWTAGNDYWFGWTADAEL